MTPIDINFAPASFARSLWHARPVALAAGLLGIVLCGGALVAALDMARQQDALQAEGQEISSRLAKVENDKPSATHSPVSEAQAKAINHAVGQLNLPWRAVLNAVENATPGSVALLSLEPEGKKFLLRGWAEAKSADDMLAYIELLKEQTFFADAALVKHEVNEQDANRPFRFQFEARWIGDES